LYNARHCGSLHSLHFDWRRFIYCNPARAAFYEPTYRTNSESKQGQR
jgi:hypothetical protein